MTEEARASAEEKFVVFLEELKKRDDRRSLAVLRRAAGSAPGTSMDVYPILVRHVPGWARGWKEQAFYLVGSLYAMHPHSWPQDQRGFFHSNFGDSWRELRDPTGEREGAGLDSRLTALLSADTDQLPYLLRGAVSLLRAKEVAVDWGLLLRDLLHWETEDKSVQSRWAKSFWSA